MALFGWLWRKAPQERLTDRLRKVILCAQCHAIDAGREVVSLDLVRALALVDRGFARCVLEEFGLHLEREFDVIRMLAAKHTPGPSLAEIVSQAKQESLALQHDFTGTEHLVLALFALNSEAGDMFRSLGVKEDAFRMRLVRILSNTPG